MKRRPGVDRLAIAVTVLWGLAALGSSGNVISDAIGMYPSISMGSALLFSVFSLASSILPYLAIHGIHWVISGFIDNKPQQPTTRTNETDT